MPDDYYDRSLKIEENTLVLDRTYLKEGVHGTISFPTGETFDTLELPWRDNTQRISCIPAGVYTLEMRYSPVVERSSGKEFSRGWEVTNVENRTYIMIHPGNYVRNFLGCIGVGMSKDFQNGVPVIWRSRDAFRKFMKLMEANETWQLVVRPLG